MTWHIMKLVGLKIEDKTVYAVLEKDGGAILPQFEKGGWESVRDIQPERFFNRPAAQAAIDKDGYWAFAREISVAVKE